MSNLCPQVIDIMTTDTVRLIQTFTASLLTPYFTENNNELLRHRQNEIFNSTLV